IRKRDVIALIEAAPTTQEEQQAEERPLHIESPYRPETPAPVAESNGGGEGILPGGHREPMSPMRRPIAPHMVEGRRTAAPCTTGVEADLSSVVAARRELKPAMQQRGVPLTYLAFVAGATIAELGRHPILNASVDGEEIVHHDDVNLGIAVALD